MNRYYILDTKQQSDQCRADCYDAYMQTVTEGEYKTQTTQWSEEQQRLTDGKYIVTVCEYFDSGQYTIESSTLDWFPVDESDESL